MCFTVPLRVSDVNQARTVMEDGRLVKTDLVGRVKAGDYLLCRQDMAVKKLSKQEATSIRRVIKETYHGLREGS